MILTSNKNFTITAVTGEGNYEIATNNAILMQLIVKAETSSTTFDVIIEDKSNNEIFGEEDYTGKCNELLSIPSYGNWILKIDNASVDEDFKCILTFRRS